MMKWDKGFSQTVMWIYRAPCAMCLTSQQIYNDMKTVLLREKQGPYPFKNLHSIQLMTVYSNCICSVYQTECKHKISLTQTLIWSPSIIQPFWKDDTATQMPLNNENVIAGSTSSLAQPVSCQTVNTVLERESGDVEKSSSLFIPEVLMQLALQWSSQARETVDLSGPSVL